MKILFEVSGEHPDIPAEEIRCIGNTVLILPQLVVAECRDPSSISRLSMTQTASICLGQSSASQSAIIALAKSLRLAPEGSFAVRVRKIFGNQADSSQVELERVVGRCIRGTVNLENPQVEYRVVLSENHCCIGQAIYHKDPSQYAARRPGNRPFFHPGVMMPGFARALVNLSGVMPGESLVDPFCGTGGILIEAALIGAVPAGCDVDEMMVRGSGLNCPDSLRVLSDARALPIRNGIVDAVVTDLPYGQSVIIHTDTMDGLYRASLQEIERILKPGHYAVVVTHRDIRSIAREFMHIDRHFLQRVHKSLTRHIMILKKGHGPGPFLSSASGLPQDPLCP